MKAREPQEEVHLLTVYALRTSIKLPGFFPRVAYGIEAHTGNFWCEGGITHSLHLHWQSWAAVWKGKWSTGKSSSSPTKMSQNTGHILQQAQQHLTWNNTGPWPSLQGRPSPHSVSYLSWTKHVRQTRIAPHGHCAAQWSAGDGLHTWLVQAYEGKPALLCICGEASYSLTLLLDHSCFPWSHGSSSGLSEVLAKKFRHLTPRWFTARMAAAIHTAQGSPLAACGAQVFSWSFAGSEHSLPNAVCQFCYQSLVCLQTLGTTAVFQKKVTYLPLLSPFWRPAGVSIFFDAMPVLIPWSQQ